MYNIIRSKTKLRAGKYLITDGNKNAYHVEKVNNKWNIFHDGDWCTYTDTLRDAQMWIDGSYEDYEFNKQFSKFLQSLQQFRKNE